MTVRHFVSLILTKIIIVIFMYIKLIYINNSFKLLYKNSENVFVDGTFSYVPTFLFCYTPNTLNGYNSR